MENMNNPSLYYLSENGNVQGPFELKILVQKISRDTLIFAENGIKWVKAEEIPEILDALLKYQEPIIPVPPSIVPTEEAPPLFSNSDHSNDVEHKENQIIAAQQDDLAQSKTYPVAETSAASTSNPTGSSKKLMYLLPMMLLLLFGGVFSYFYWIQPYLKDKNAPRKYCYVESLVVRSSKISGVDYNAIGKCSYGNELIVYEDDGTWATCKFNDKECFVASKFLLGKEDFHLLHSIFSDADTREAVGTAKCRIALLDYYKRNGLMGNIDNASQIEIFGKLHDYPVWVLTARKKNLKPNTVVYPRVVNDDSKYTDFGCLIQNVSTGNRKFLLFSFTDEEQPILQLEEEAPRRGLIRGVYKHHYWDGVQYYVDYSH